MANWKNLIGNPPDENCTICLKVGTDCEVYKFKTLGNGCWELAKYPRRFGMEKVPKHALYIILDDIK